MTEIPEESPHYEWCMANDHPPVTYNPLVGKTWCACGSVIRAGDAGKDHTLCCGEAS